MSDLATSEFLQSLEWETIIQAKGGKTLRLGANFITHHPGTLFIEKPLLGGYHYLYVPRGPLVSVAETAWLVTEITARDKRLIFIRLEPSTKLEIAGRVIKKTVNQQPAKTLMLDLRLRETKLLAGLHQKTRYNLRLAQKKGVEIKRGQAIDFPEFWRLMTLTGKRDNFRLHARDHYENLLKSQAVKLYFARYQGQNIAAGLFCFFGNRVTYLHGASDNKFRNVMAPYLLQWTVIQEAQAAGYWYYDFYGIDEKKWPGVTRFKLGFGGTVLEYPGTFDVVLRPGLYWLYSLGRRLRRLI